jgi:hypothetical protein
VSNRFKIVIGVASMFAVLGMFFSVAVPMPKSVLHAKQLASAVSMQVTGMSIAGTVALMALAITPDEVSQPSGTELINRLCSRIC